MANLTSAQIVLAGGRSQRLGGVDKSRLLFRNRSLLTHALTAGSRCCHQVVAGPAELVVPDSVGLVQEDPPFGGPVAGIGAGVAELQRRGCAAEWVMVTACDHPLAEAAAMQLFDAAAGDLDGIDLIAPVDASGHTQNLFALYRRSALHRALARVSGGRNLSVRRLVAGLGTRSPVLTDGLLDDIDDPMAAARMGIAVQPDR